MKSQRNGSIELLRLMLMFMVVLYHAWERGVYCQDVASAPQWWSVFLNVFVIWHVDGFVAISGWFGIKFSWRKFLRVYGQILFYSIVGLGVLAVVDPSSFSWGGFKVDGGWFAGSYLMLMLFAPLLNAAVDHLSAGGGGLVGSMAPLGYRHDIGKLTQSRVVGC